MLTEYRTYKIVPCSCVCGGNIAWMGQRSSGAWEMLGCVCHQTPLGLVGPPLSVTTDSEDDR